MPAYFAFSNRSAGDGFCLKEQAVNLYRLPADCPKGFNYLLSLVAAVPQQIYVPCGPMCFAHPEREQIGSFQDKLRTIGRTAEAI